MALMPLLPKLKILWLGLLPRHFHLHADFQHLLGLSGLTRLVISSRYNCNEILMELAKRLQLVELCIWMNFDANSFEIIKAFDNLEVLSIGYRRNWQENWFASPSIFSPKLKQMRVYNLRISCTAFLKLAKQLKFLEKFYIGNGGMVTSHVTLNLFQPLVSVDRKFYHELSLT